MNPGGDFQAVRKGKGRVHLVIALRAGDVITTLCDKHFGSGEVEAVAMEADCQACLRRRGDPGRVSSAYFEGGRGSALLELSLQQARERRDAARESGGRPATPPTQRAPHLRIVPTEPRERPPPLPEKIPAPVVKPPAPARAQATPADQRPELTELAPGWYQTGAGVVVRVVAGGQEKPRFERRRGQRVQIIAGDLEIEVGPESYR